MIKEITVEPTQIVNAKLFKYYKNGKTNKYATITLNDGKVLTLSSDRLNQIFRYLPVTQKDLFDIPYPERDQTFLRYIRNSETTFVISYIPDNNRIVRIVSSEFQPIPHRVVIDLIEKSIKTGFVRKEISYEHGLFGKWYIEQLPKACAEVSDIVDWYIWAYNYNIGHKALRIGGGFTVLACKNGALAWKGCSKIHIIHRGNYDEILGKIQEAIDKIVNYSLVKMAEQIITSKNLTFNPEQIKPIIKKYPDWIQNIILQKLSEAKTVWDVSNIFSYIATHHPVTFNQQIELSNQAIQILEVIR